MRNTPSELAISGGKPVFAMNNRKPHFTWPIIGKAEINAVVNQLKNGVVSYYRVDGVIEEFEQSFAAYHSARFAISTNSGSAAIHAAFFSLNLPVGAEVIAPAYTHLSTVFPMIHAGLVPVLCDIEEETGNIDAGLIESKLSADTRAIVVTHQYGHICDMDRILAIANKHNLYVIEDASHAHGATLDNKLAGTFGDIACFSLQSHKSVWGGEGGILITNRPELANRASLLGHFRQKRDFTPAEHDLLTESGYGLKNRLHPLAAALAKLQLKKLATTISSRAENYRYFLSLIKDIKAIKPLTDKEGADRGGFFRFVMRYDPAELDNLPIETYIEALRAEGVLTVMPGSLAKPVHYFNFFHDINNGFYPLFFKDILEKKANKMIYKTGDFPKAEYFSAHTIQFPPFTLPSKGIIKKYVQAMKKIEVNLEDLKNNHKSPGL